MNNKNIFCTYLSLINVKHTKLFATKLFNAHPHKYNLFGLSKMFSEYNIKSKAIRIAEYNEILLLKPPFIAHTETDFVIVKAISKDKIAYLWRDKEVYSTLDIFFQFWTGIVLLTETSRSTIEPNYLKHKKIVMANLSHIILLLLCSIILCALGLVIHDSFEYSNRILLLCVNIVGIYIGILLIQKQLHINNSHTNKVCFLFSKHDCNNVLESEKSKFLGVISWSELGLGYFISNFLLITFAPNLLIYLSIINIIILPYSFWSVWYQKFIIKQWCSLCLIVQLLLWCNFILNIISNSIQSFTFNVTDILISITIYSLPFLLIHLLIPYWSNSKKAELFLQNLSSLKMRENVYSTLLYKGKHYKSDSCILFGNLKAKNKITVLTNPHCEPCGRIHDQLNKLLKDTNNGFCIQYIFTSFGTEFDISSKFLIATYLNRNIGEVERIYSEWYKVGKYNKESFISKFRFDLTEQRVVQELEYHNNWKDETHFLATPTILFNEYEIPDEYEVDDLKYFVNIDIY